MFRGRSVRFGGNRLASLERTSRCQHEPENLKPGLSLPAVPFLFRRMFLFLTLFLPPFVISASLFLAIPPFPLFTMVPLLAFVRSLRCLALGMRGRCTSLFLSCACLLARSLRFSLSFHLCFTHSRVLLTRTRFSSPLSRFAGLPPTHPPLDWGLSGKKGSRCTNPMIYIFILSCPCVILKNRNFERLQDFTLFLTH